MQLGAGQVVTVTPGSLPGDEALSRLGSNGPFTVAEVRLRGGEIIHYENCPQWATCPCMREPAEELIRLHEVPDGAWFPAEAFTSHSMA